PGAVGPRAGLRGAREDAAGHRREPVPDPGRRGAVALGAPGVPAVRLLVAPAAAQLGAGSPGRARDDAGLTRPSAESHAVRQRLRLSHGGPGVRVLITGGAGFIGSHLADRLIALGARVRVLDSLEAQVHPGRERPGYLHPEAELVVGDVRHRETVISALEGLDAVYHLAARVGVGQSMYEMEGYTSANTVGTAVLLEALVDRPVKRLVVASSMSIYGEGRCVDDRGRAVDPAER